MDTHIDEKVKQTAFVYDGFPNSLKNAIARVGQTLAPQFLWECSQGSRNSGTTHFWLSYVETNTPETIEKALSRYLSFRDSQEQNSRQTIPLFIGWHIVQWERVGFEYPTDYLWDVREPFDKFLQRIAQLTLMYPEGRSLDSFRDFSVGFVRRQLGLSQEHHSTGTDTMTAIVALRGWLNTRSTDDPLPERWTNKGTNKQPLPAFLRHAVERNSLCGRLFPACSDRIRASLDTIESLAKPVGVNRLGTASPSNYGNTGGFLDGGRTCGEPQNGFAITSIDKSFPAALETNDKQNNASDYDGALNGVSRLETSFPRWRGYGLWDFLSVKPCILVVDDESQAIIAQLDNLRFDIENEDAALANLIRFESAFENKNGPDNFKAKLVSFLSDTKNEHRLLRRFDAVLLDLSFHQQGNPDQDALGWSLLPLLRRFLPDIPIIVHSSFGDATQVRRAYVKGADWFLKKNEGHKLPSRLRELLRTSLWRKEWNAMGSVPDLFDMTPPYNIDPSLHEERNCYLWCKVLECLPGDDIRIQKLGGSGGAVTVKAWKRVGKDFDLLPPMIVKIDDYFPMSMEYERYQRFIYPYLSNRVGRVDRRAVRAGYSRSAIGYTCAGNSQGVHTTHAQLEIVDLETLLKRNLDRHNAVVIPAKHYSSILNILLADILPRIHNIDPNYEDGSNNDSDYPNIVFGEFRNPLDSYLARFPASYVVNPKHRMESYSTGTGHPLMIIEPDTKESLIQCLLWDEDKALHRIDLVGPMAEYYINARHLRRYQMIRLHPDDKPQTLAANGWARFAKRLQTTPEWIRYAPKSCPSAITILNDATFFLRKHAADILGKGRKGIIHGDMNLGNIMVEHERDDPIPASGEPWLIDFARTRRDAIAVDYAQLEIDILLRLAKPHVFIEEDSDDTLMIAFRDAYLRSLSHPPPQAVSRNKRLVFIWSLMNQVHYAAKQAGIEQKTYEHARLLALMLVAKILLKKLGKDTILSAVQAVLWIGKQHDVLMNAHKKNNMEFSTR